jgi:hypothetical protein
MLGADGSLLYVGKASSIRRRLEAHSRGPKRPDDVRAQRLVATACEVRYIVCESEREALCLEADLIIAFVPPYNASMAFETYTYVHVLPGPGTLRLTLTEHPPPRSGRVYGGFPHLGKGRASWRGVRTSAGYSALLRSLWVAFTDGDARTRMPARLHGKSPPVDHSCSFDGSYSRALHDLLSGRSARLLRDLRKLTSDDGVPEYMRGALDDDLVGAEEFHVIGPRRLHRLRVRHGLKPGPLDRETFTRLVTDETQAAVGAFTWTVEPPRRGRRLVPTGEA